MSLSSSIKLANDYTKNAHIIEAHDKKMLSCIQFTAPKQLSTLHKGFTLPKMGYDWKKLTIKNSNTREELFRGVTTF
ncbi:hypothetical protein SteCoe_10031 [Stentor coeruleus]|uniref:Uncharacterized protein n=1 Tax=Stentor coeruleus TaxID=5963 RepID=A0A1R2CGR3_9CILI|nr:hypothetical protein SteCoe_10031 [Stentor coeruleus]